MDYSSNILDVKVCSYNVNSNYFAKLFFQILNILKLEKKNPNGDWGCTQFHWRKKGIFHKKIPQNLGRLIPS